MAPRSRRSAAVVGSTLLAAAIMLLAWSPTALGGAVFEVKEPILPNPDDYRILFDKPAPPNTAGSILRSSTPYNATSIPLAFFTINKCGVLSFHFHPLGAEQLLVLEGRIEVGMFMEDNVFRKVLLKKEESIYIPQGTVHFVRNANKHGGSRFLQLFDHPGAGAVFVGPALLGMPRDILDAAFTSAFPAAVSGNPFFTLPDHICKKFW